MDPVFGKRIIQYKSWSAAYLMQRCPFPHPSTPPERRGKAPDKELSNLFSISSTCYPRNWPSCPLYCHVCYLSIFQLETKTLSGFLWRGPFYYFNVSLSSSGWPSACWPLFIYPLRFQSTIYAYYEQPRKDQVECHKLWSWNMELTHVLTNLSPICDQSVMFTKYWFGHDLHVAFPAYICALI